MERLFDVSAGIDVHRDTVVVSVRRKNQVEREVQTRTFETFRDSLIEMAQWLQSESVEIIGLESTGVYWRPVVRALQECVPATVLWLVNPAQVRKVPGRKTDVKDSQWLSRLVMHGLVAPSFLPSPQLQELRKLTRHRTKVIADRTRYKNRILKELESSGFKLATVCSNALGKTGRAILDALLEGKQLSSEDIDKLAHGNLRKKTGLIRRAIGGSLTLSTCVVLRQMLQRLDSLDADLAVLDQEIFQRLTPMKAEVELLHTIPGFDASSAAVVLAEMGPDMSIFPAAPNLVSWAGLSPGSEESAGKAKKAPTRKGDKYLRTIMVQVALAASRTKGSSWQRLYRKLFKLGPKKAQVALARKLLIVVYKVLSGRTPYREFAPSPHQVLRTLHRLTAQIEALGFSVALQPRPLEHLPAVS